MITIKVTAHLGLNVFVIVFFFVANLFPSPIFDKKATYSPLCIETMLA